MNNIDTIFSRRELDVLGGDAPTPLYFQLFTLLKNRILDGSIAHGTQLPTEQQLAEAFGVSRITAKRAMDELAAQELVERRRGRGTHVIHHYESKPVLAPLSGMLEHLTSMGRNTRIKVIDVGLMVPPGDICSELGLNAGEKAWRLLRVRSTENGEPFAYYISWTIGVSEGFTRENLEKRLRLNILCENGIHIARIEQYFTAALAMDFFAKELEMREGEPSLMLTRRSFDADDKLVDILYGYYNPRRYQYKMLLSIDR
jgi:GntR family transcriptional regulator